MRKFSKVVCTLGVFAASTSAFAGGYEKNILWGASEVGVGGAVTSSVSGPDSLFYNPAGLATGREGLEVSGNFSPTIGHFSGPVAQTTGAIIQADGNTTFSPVFGVLASYNINPQWGIGIGTYVSGGNKASFENIDAGSGLTIPTVKSDLWAVEVALGTGYEVLPGLKFGGDWRMVSVHANFATTQTIAGPTILNITLNDLSKTKWNGFRLGAQYAPSKTWGLGVTWRTRVDFVANGTSGGTNVNSGAALTAGTASVGSSLPSQISAGGNVGVTDSVRLFADYTWSQYGVDQALAVSGTVNGLPLSNIALNWKNQSNIRLGAACTAVQDWTFRAGWVITTQVTPNDSAKINVSSPGTGYSYTLGAGTQFLDKKMDADIALEYSHASGAGTAPATVGDYSSWDFATHLSVAYRF